MHTRWTMFMLAIFGLSVGTGTGQVQETFESPVPSWEVRDADCTMEIREHERSFTTAHSGRASEHVRLRAGHGTHVYLAHPVSPARIIDELQPRVWIKADRLGIQLLARAVLPRSTDSKGHILTTLLYGTIYREVGSWQQLRIDDVARELERQVRILRIEHGPQVDSREAYIDLLVLNAYGGPGVTNLWIDDLELAGFASSHVPAQAASFGSRDNTPVAVGRSADEHAGTERVRRDGDLLLVEGRPFFVRMIERQGESFAYLKSLGFNTVFLKTPPTDLDQTEAERLGLWLVAPLPRGNISSTPSRRVLAWAHQHPTGGEHTSSPYRRDPTSTAEPITPLSLVPLHDPHSSGDPRADVVMFHLPVAGTTFPLRQFQATLRRWAARAAPELPFLVAVDTQLPDSLVRQVEPSHDRGSFPTWVEPLQLRLLVAHAVAAGARGVFFRSRSPLGRSGPGDRLRELALQDANLQLSVIEPWLAGGRYGGEVETRSPHVRVHLLESSRSRLLIGIHEVSDQQLVAPPWPDEDVVVSLFGMPLTEQPYLIGPTDLESLRSQRSGGIHVRFSNPDAVALVLLTQDPLALNHVRRNLLETRQSRVELRCQIARLLLDETRRIENQLPVANPVPANRSSRSDDPSQLALRAAALSSSGDLREAWLAATRSLQQTYDRRRRHWERVARSFHGPADSPLAMSFAALPVHWQLVEQMSTARWSSNLLPGGDFESLDQMLAAGWRQERSEAATAMGSVELSYERARTGRSALHIALSDDARTRYAPDDRPPVTIASPPILVTPGQWVRIQGWIHIPEPISDNADGLLVLDSLGGIELAQRFTHTNTWQPFACYRRVVDNQPLEIQFILTGPGDVWIDGVTVEVAR